MKKIISIILLSVTVLACKKDEILFDTTPSIEFVSITPSSVTEFEDEVILTILYRDGDGDLGENNPEVKNLFVTDSRNDVQYSFRVQQLAPVNADIKIEGELAINLKTLSVVGSGNSESATFSVYIVDRSGNKSNTIITSAITVSK